MEYVAPSEMTIEGGGGILCRPHKQVAQLVFISCQEIAIAIAPLAVSCIRFYGTVQIGFNINNKIVNLHSVCFFTILSDSSFILVRYSVLRYTFANFEVYCI